MKTCLNPATLRRTLEPREFVSIAGRAGFQGVEVPLQPARELVDRYGADAVRDMFATAGVTPASSGYRISWPGAMDEFRDRLDELAPLAATAAALGIPGGTVVLPFRRSTGIDDGPELVDKLRAVADLVGARGLAAYLEFIGLASEPTERGDFVTTLPRTLDLIARVDRPNVGLLVDAYHWYLGGGTAADIRAIPRGLPLFVHINDAPPGPRDTLTDPMRVLPGDGVIDLPSFLAALRHVGYDGFVSLEIFNADLHALDPTEAARRGHAALAPLLTAAIP